MGVSIYHRRRSRRGKLLAPFATAISAITLDAGSVTVTVVPRPFSLSIWSEPHAVRPAVERAATPDGSGVAITGFASDRPGSTAAIRLLKGS
jgi:hypothetical protein